jgi:hypothetical protein
MGASNSLTERGWGHLAATIRRGACVPLLCPTEVINPDEKDRTPLRTNWLGLFTW